MGRKKKKLTLRLDETLHVETRNLSATKTFVRSSASVCTMQNADKDERERKRKRERKKGNCGIGGYGSGKPTPTAESVAPPCAVRLGHCPTRICRGRCVGCAVCSGLPGVLISDCFISSGGGGGVVVFWGKVSRKVFKFKFRTSIFHCKLVSKGLGTYLAHLNQSE